MVAAVVTVALGGPDTRRLVRPHAPLLRLLPRPAHTGARGARRRRHGRHPVGAPRRAGAAAGAARRRRLRRAHVDHEPGEPRARCRAARHEEGAAGYPYVVPRRRADGAGRRRARGLRRQARRAARCSTSAAGSAGTRARSPSAASTSARSTSCPTMSSARARSAWMPSCTTARRMPMEDGSVDTVILLEVLEHLDDPAALLREARRVARTGVLVTTPNCTQDFGEVPVEFSHMLDVDHRQFFTEASLRRLLDEVFGSSVVEQTAPIDRHLAGSSCLSRCAPSTAGSTAPGSSSRASSSACSGARPPARDTRPVRVGRAGGRGHGGSRDPRGRAGPRARRALRGHGRRAGAERSGRRARRAARGRPVRLRARCSRRCASTTSSWPSGFRRSCCATSARLPVRFVADLYNPQMIEVLEAAGAADGDSSARRAWRSMLGPVRGSRPRDLREREAARPVARGHGARRARGPRALPAPTRPSGVRRRGARSGSRRSLRGTTRP